MKRVMLQQIPGYIKKEIDLLGERLKPLIKKSSIYSFISLPMILFSLSNLFFLLVIQGMSKENLYYSLLFALFASVGLALMKESKNIQKEVQQLSIQYIIERISKSNFVPEMKKKEFIQNIINQPILGINTFIQFLEEEKKLKQI